LITMRHIYFAFACVLAAVMVSCSKNQEQEPAQVTVLEVSTAQETKTHMGPSSAGTRPVYWSNGDQLALNGTASTPLDGVGENATSANFSFPGVLNTPYRLLYPASFTTEEHPETITLPATQDWVAGGIATNTLPLVGYMEEGSSITLSHLSTILHLQIKKDAGVSDSKLASVTFTGLADEQVSGSFTLNYATATLTGTSAPGEGRSVTVNPNQPLNGDTALDVFIVVPAGTYENGFKVVMTDQYNRVMTKQKSSSITLNPGKQVNMTEFTFVPSALATEFTIQDVIEEVLAPDGYNITGRVVDNSGNGLEGVVVSDGTQCIRSACDGTFYMTSTIADVKFVHISTPSGYKPTVVNGIPKFYKAKADVTPEAGIYDFGDFVVYPATNPNRFTLLISADPQPRKYSGWNNDRIAYRSLDVCEDLYDELASVKAGITDREVYGICLGDIVHETMDLFDNYDTGLARLGYPTYNIIGNHDNDPSAADDDAAAATFESHYGPRNYSFNIGGIHFVMLDNLIMKDNGGKLTGFDQGLSDEIWTWLQNDMAMIPTTTKIMVCAHSPMFRYINGSERTNTAYHAGTHSDKDGGAYGYGDLFDTYTEVHAWAGHTHVGFNYNYPNNHRHKKIQVHTLARSTGELWTNEYLASGTPRGFTVVDVDNGNITWKFHPLTQQTGEFVGVKSGICTAGAPAYNWRDWNYNGDGDAVMKVGGGELTEDYQLHVYPRGSYGDNYVYANVFLWDSKWSKPVWTPAGGAPVEMTLLHDSDGSYIGDTEKIYDLATTEFKSHYKPNVGFFKYDDGYPASEIGEICTMFRAPANASPNSGTVSVTDRFGNTYTRTVSW